MLNFCAIAPLINASCGKAPILPLHKSRVMKKFCLWALLGLVAGVANAQFNLDWNLFCVEAVYYDTVPNQLVVIVSNANSNHINYPVVQVINPQNDTIGNPQGTFDMFAQIGGSTQDYHIPVTQNGITDFSGYTFLMRDESWDTSGVIGKCFISGIKEKTEGPEVLLQGNYGISLKGDFIGEVIFTDLSGSRIELPKTAEQSWNISELAPAVYLLSVKQGGRWLSKKFVKY